MGSPIPFDDSFFVETDDVLGDGKQSEECRARAEPECNRPSILILFCLGDQPSNALRVFGMEGHDVEDMLGAIVRRDL